MKVLAVTSEFFPLVKTGGLADVAGALPAALAAETIDVVTLLPGYPAVLSALGDADTVWQTQSLFGGPARALRGAAAGQAIIAIEAPHLYGRAGNPYLAPDGTDWPDNAQRFAALGAVAAALAQDEVTEWQPDMLHLHDWQAGLAAAYLRQAAQRAPGIVATVHNLAFQGVFQGHMLAQLGLDPQHFDRERMEYHGAISFLKSALVYADRVTTVSPTYADEIRTPEGGMGLDGVLRARGGAVRGILNGIDTDIWDPATDALIAASYRVAQPRPRALNKAALQKRLGLASSPRALLCGLVSRLTWQKGFDLLLECLPILRSAGMQLAVLGSGEPGMEAALRAACAHDPSGVACVIGYDEALAHLVQAGSDALLVPSRFEPCGLTQLCALRYGAIPVVARTGGLADTVIDANAAALARGAATGIQFVPGTCAALERGLRRLADLWRDPPTWRRVQRNGMSMDVSWKGPAAAYARLFRGLAATP